MPGPIAALVGGSLASSVIGANAAKKAGQAQAAAADAATNLQREIYNDTTERFAPYLGAGNNALAAMLYEMGLGPKPTFGATAPAIEEVTTTTPRRNVKPQPQVGDSPAFGGILNNKKGGKTTTTFKVGDKTFETRSAAEEWANANKTGGTEYGGYTQSPMARYLMEQGVDSIEGSAASSGGLFSGATLQALEDNRRRVISADTGDYFARLMGMTNMGLGAAGNQASAGANYASNAGSTMMAAGNARADAALGRGQAFQTGISDMAGIMGFMQGSNPMAAYTSPTLMATSPRPMANPRF